MLLMKFSFWSADDVNILGENINTIKRNIEALLEASREVGLEINTQTLVYGYVSPRECKSEL
jgi:hypothetical protein